jgi:hypothetical protein
MEVNYGMTPMSYILLLLNILGLIGIYVALRLRGFMDKNHKIHWDKFKN